MHSDVRRLKLTLAYRGTAYHGWQFQRIGDDVRLPTVQGVLRKACVHVLRHPLTLVGSSRTDSGVHAKGQVAHLSTHMVHIPLDGLRRAINAALPDDVVVRSIEPVPLEFDAIRNATHKRYQYALWNRPDKPVFFGELCWHRREPLDVPAMRAAARQLEGMHDFASFARAGHGRSSTVRTVFSCQVSARGGWIVIGVEGNGFLWNQVRILAGTLVEVGQGRRDAASMPEVLAARDRQAAGSTAPPQGLYLQWIRHAMPNASETP